MTVDIVIKEQQLTMSIFIVYDLLMVIFTAIGIGKPRIRYRDTFFFRNAFPADCGD